MQSLIIHGAMVPKKHPDPSDSYFPIIKILIILQHLCIHALYDPHPALSLERSEGLEGEQRP